VTTMTTQGVLVEVEFISIPEWGRRVGISRNAAYRAARLGSISGCIQVGKRYIVNWSAFVQRSASAGGRGEPEQPAH
jgi:hypothetical protein